MRHVNIISALLCLSLSATAQPTDRYVDYANGDDINHNGTSFSGDAYKTLQKALSVAGSGDTIHVAANTYYPDEGGGQMNGDEAASFGMLEGMTLLGGYPAGGGARNPAVNVTILSGDIDQNGLDTDNSQHVVTAYSRTNAILIDGFTIKQGYADGTSLEVHGGGLFIYNCANVTVQNCTFTDNFALSNGAGMFVYQHTSGGPNTSTTTVTDSDFEGNECDNAGAGVSYLNAEGAGHTLTVTGCDFTENTIDDTTDPAAGGGIDVDGAEFVTITDCEFNGNYAMHYGGAIRILSFSSTVAEVEISGCGFDDNVAELESGGAIYINDVGETNIEDCVFLENEADKGGGAIWVLTTRSDVSLRHTVFNVDNCDFIRNYTVTTINELDGGGAIFLSGNANDGDYAGLITGTISNCDFIENGSLRGGAMYFHSCGAELNEDPVPLHVKDCRFIGNEAFTGPEGGGAGGAMGIGNDTPLAGSDVRVSRSVFVSNKGVKGGAIHNHEGALTYMVNCRFTGNTSTQEGGAIFNSRHTGSAVATLNLHNCLIAGNIADGTGSLDMGGGVFSGLDEDDAAMEMVHCTLVGNYAGYRYGGAVNYGGNAASVMLLRNSIAWGNSDADGGSDDLDAELYYSPDTLDDDHVDHNVIDDLDDDPDRFEVSMNEVNTESNPVFFDNGSGSITWTAAAYDYTTGKTTFTTTNTTGAAVNELFKPSTSDAKMLVIASVVANTSVTCWGYWANGSGTAKLYDLQIQDGGSAYDFGGDYVPLDYCDLDNDTEFDDDLPIDLFGNTRVINGTPDCGVHETTPTSFSGG